MLTDMCVGYILPSLVGIRTSGACACPISAAVINDLRFVERNAIPTRYLGEYALNV